MKRNQPGCYYNNDPKNGEKYGKLYNGYAVLDMRGLAPDGWHIPSSDVRKMGTNQLPPTKDELKILFDFLGPEMANKMKSKNGWDKNSDKNPNETNSNSFNGLPGGYRNDVGEFKNIGIGGYWWKTYFYNEYAGGENDKKTDCFSLLSDGIFDRCGNNLTGYSVRCIKDETSENKSAKVISDKKADFEGNWVADANSEVVYDGNRIIDITVTKNGANFLFAFNKNNLGLKTMGAVDHSNNISLFGGEWLVALDATDSDNLFLKGQIFHRVK